MKANPGGHIPPAEVLGRDALIDRVWRSLERRSVLLTAERRMGKTCLAKKMVAEARPGFVVVYRDLEAVRSPLELVDAVFRDATDRLGRLGRAAWRVRALVVKLGGAEIARTLKLPAKLGRHWKPLLGELGRDLAEAREERVVLVWDEVPLMLFNIQEQRSPAEAMEVLDTLRALRQENPSLRMVFTGSVGMHNVVRALHAAGYANDPTNDMDEVEVPPLAPADAAELADRLLAGEGVPCADRGATARAVAEATDGIPFYIHHVVDRIHRSGGTADPAAARRIVDECCADVADPWHLTHLRERFEHYYAAGEARLALLLLDLVATSARPCSADELFDGVQARAAVRDPAAVRAVLSLLERDHYLGRTGDGAWGFRFGLIERWWKRHRGLRP